MSPEERQMLAGLFDRIRAAAGSARDRDAEALINEAVRQQPYAPYLLAQTVLMQEQTLQQAAQRVQQLDAQVQDLQSRQSAPQDSGSTSFLGGIGKSIFGSSAHRRCPGRHRKPCRNMPRSQAMRPSPARGATRLRSSNNRR